MESGQGVTHLLDGDCWLPRLLLVEDGETDGSGRVDVGVEEGRRELACVIHTTASSRKRG
jgi:hypothetical protein